ncbi:MAG TPA: AbrB/MazE/SpoVT family DNA-binding domain-containing protein [Bryobacteraceae bacterium]|nr:AbrB/MazE/SpoVT family DNA-binding domain-containing protein [Bryobacteraceae bacterium]
MVIPREIFEKLHMQEGDFVAFTQKPRGVLVTPKRVVDVDQVLTPAESRKVRRGMKQIKQGRFKLWQDIKDELGR